MASVHHIVPRIEAQASGPSYSVPRLCEAVAIGGKEVSLHVLDPLPAGRQYLFPVSNYPARALPSLRLGRSPELKKALLEIGRSKDAILHNHSLWMMPNIYPAAARKQGRCKLVSSPRGTMSPWARVRSRWKKMAMWHFGQRAMLEACDLFHATSSGEAEEIREMGFESKPIATIPNGVDLPPLGAGIGEAKAKRRIVFLSRIHPKKGVDVLLRCWKRIADDNQDWELLIYGPENRDGYRAKMKTLAETEEIPRVSFPGAVYDDAKWEVLFKADLFVLPTHSENFGVAVAEALSCRTPCIVTKGAPWSGLPSHDCGWWVNNAEAAIEAAMREAVALPPERLEEMGSKGRDWMERSFSWNEIAERMVKCYEWLLHGGRVPDDVEVESLKS